MSDSDSEQFALPVHDKDTDVAFSRGDKNANRENGPTMESSVLGESEKRSPSIGFNFDFLPSLPGSKVKAPNIDPKDKYDAKRIFTAVANHDVKDLAALKSYLYKTMKHLTEDEFTEGVTKKTCLMKAMFNLRDGMNDTIPVLLEADSKRETLVNAAYADEYYKGQTALHIAIEKRSFQLVKLLMENKADVHARAEGTFFQKKKKGVSFYFGELPLSLAACTNQPNIVDYLLNNPYNRADLKARDSHGNTVLHALVLVADNTTKNTELISKMYDHILKKSTMIDPEMDLEGISNWDGLTPLKLAAKTGKIQLFEHILQREITEPEYRHLSRKFTEWTYGPVHTSLYDMSSVDSYEPDSVLETIVFNSDANNRHKMIVLEPLNNLLQEKWDRFAGKIFCLKFFFYVLYMIIFTVTAYHRPLEGQPPFPLEGTHKDNLRVLGEVIMMFGGLYIFICQIVYFWKRRPSLQNLIMDGYFEILFFLQAIILLSSGITYLAGSEVYVALMVFSLVIGWVNMLYYTRGFQQTGIYSVMIQKTILRDMLRFLFVYLIFLVGFAAALVTLIGEAPHKAENSTNAGPSEAENSYSGLYIATLELFKFTIGMGDLEFNENLKFKHFFMFLLILYVILTYVLLLNMLIALMSETVNKVSYESKSVWKLQRAATILDIERFMPKRYREKFRSTRLLAVRSKSDGTDDKRWCFRVEELQWESFGENLSCINEEPGYIDKVHKKSKGQSQSAQEKTKEEKVELLSSVSTSPSNDEKV